VIIFKNESLAFVELEQKASGFLEFATDLQSPDFAKIAEGAGLLGLTARTPDQVEPMIAQALKHDGPAVVEVFVARQELAMPPTITLEQAKVSVSSCSKPCSTGVVTKSLIWRESICFADEFQ